MCDVNFNGGPADGATERVAGFCAPAELNRDVFDRGHLERQVYRLRGVRQRERERPGAWPVVWWEAEYDYAGPAAGWPGGDPRP